MTRPLPSYKLRRGRYHENYSITTTQPLALALFAEARRRNLTEKQIVADLGYSTTTVYNWRRRGIVKLQHAIDFAQLLDLNLIFVSKGQIDETLSLADSLNAVVNSRISR